MAFNVGSFVGGLFDGFKAGQDIIKARNDLRLQAMDLEAADKAYEEMNKPGSAPGAYGAGEYGGGGPGGETQVSGEGLPPEARQSGANRRGWGAPTPEMAELIQKSAAENNIPPEILFGVLGTESNFDPRAVSKANAKGIAQFIDSTAKGIGLKDPFDWTQAIPASAKLIRQNLDRYGGDATNAEQMAKALRAYNAGFDQTRWNNAETRAYVPSVLARAQQYGTGSSNRIALPEVRPSGVRPAAEGLPSATMGGTVPSYARPGSGLSTGGGLGVDTSLPTSTIGGTPVMRSSALGTTPGLSRATFDINGIPKLPGDATNDELDAAYDYVESKARTAGSGGGEPAGQWAVSPIGAGGDSSMSALGNSVPSPLIPGNVDLYNRPQTTVRTGPGATGTATLHSFSFGTPQGEVLVPQVSDDGRLWSPEEARENFFTTGKHLGIFRTPKEADAYGKKLSKDQERLLKERQKQQTSGALF